MKDDVKLIPIESIQIINPRHRERKRFEQIVQSIQNLGLKKPIKVSVRGPEEDGGPGYDLVCGQGRLEAFIALGHKEIPAIIVNVPKDERLLSSLVENIARRTPSPLAVLHEIERLQSQGYSNVQIGLKLDIGDTTIGGYLALKRAGEERLLDAAISGAIPLGVAMDIAKAQTPEMQRELLRAYQSKQLNQFSIRTLRKIMDQRRFVGKERDPNPRRRQKRTSAESLVSAYRRESQRQKLLVRKARVCDAKLLFIITAFQKLLADDHFITLLRAETLATMPKYLHDRLTPQRKQAA